MMRRLLLGLTLFFLAGCGAEYEPALEAVGPSSEEIVGGASYYGLPAVGALFVDGQPHCTGTLITRRKVLTAAHCVVGVTPGRMKFRIGANAFAPRYVLAVQRLVPHPAYDPYELTSDIAYVVLTANAPVEPLPMLGSMDDSFVGVPLFFVGYGVNDATAQTGAGRKRAVWIPLEELGATQFSYATLGRNTCNGDSGGPALYKGYTSGYRVAGVTSWGDVGCELFGIDTRVDAFLSFLGG